MPKSRKEKIDNFKYYKDKKLSLGAGIILYIVLKKYGIDSYSIKYCESKKPYID